MDSQPARAGWGTLTPRQIELAFAGDSTLAVTHRPAEAAITLIDARSGARRTIADPCCSRLAAIDASQVLVASSDGKSGYRIAANGQTAPFAAASPVRHVTDDAAVYFVDETSRFLVRDDARDLSSTREPIGLPPEQFVALPSGGVLLATHSDYDRTLALRVRRFELPERRIEIPLK